MSEKIAALIVSGCLALSVNSDAQDIKKIELKGLYVGTFAQVLDQISREHSVKFSFDRAVLAKRKVQDCPDNLPLEEFLEYWCFLFDLRFSVTDNKVIIIDEEVQSGYKKNTEKKVRWSSKRRSPSIQPY